MTKSTYKSFVELRNALSGKVPSNGRQDAPAVTPKFEEHPVAGSREMTPRRVKNAPRQPDRAPVRPRPQVKTPVIPLKKSFADLIVVIEKVFAARGLPNAVAFASYAMGCLSKVVERRSGTAEGTVMTALESVARDVSGHSGTRCKRLLSILSETPAVSGGFLVRLPKHKGEISVVQVERPREASSALELSRVLCHVDEPFLADLDTAKTTLRDSLRVERLRHIRRVTPDFGSALVAASVVSSEGEAASLGGLSVPTLDWAIRSVKDLRDVVAEEDRDVLKESLRHFSSAEEDLDTAQQRALSAIDAALEHLRYEFRSRSSSGHSQHGRTPVILEPRLPLRPKV